MSIIFERIQSLCDIKGIKINALEKEIGINHGTIQKWRNKKDLNPTSSVLINIADYFNVSVDYLLGRCDNPISHMSEPKTYRLIKQLLEAFRKLKHANCEAENYIQHILEEADVGLGLFGDQLPVENNLTKNSPIGR